MQPMQRRAREPVGGLVQTPIGWSGHVRVSGLSRAAVSPLVHVFGENVSVLLGVCLGWGCWATCNLLLS